MGSGGFAAAAILIGGGVLARRGGLTTSNLAVVLAVVVVASSCGCVCRGQRCHDEEKRALLELEESSMASFFTRGDDQEDCCRWIGVTCSNNNTGRVVGISLMLWKVKEDETWYPNFTSLVQLRELEGLSITLADGRIGSTSLNDLCDLKYLKALSLSLWSHPVLVGPIPQCLCNMRSLTSLHVIDFGRLSGSSSRDITIMDRVGVPSCLGRLRNLESLMLSGIEIVGNTSFLDDLCHLKYLRALHLYGTWSSTEGRGVPQCLCNKRSLSTLLVSRADNELSRS